MNMEQALRVLVPLALGALVLGGCSNGGHSNARSTTTTVASTTASASSTSTTADLGPAQNQTATAALKSQLTAAYVAHNHLPANEVAGTAPGSVYYAFIPSTNTYWAIASFYPTANSSQQTQVSMQDEGCCGVFTETTGGSWTMVAGFLGAPCPGQIPAQLETLWGLQYPGNCPSSSANSTS
jgi:hypothetical protein